jgi:iron complex outermembrane receptor protein
MKYIYFIILGSLIISNAKAQHTLSGTISNQQNQEPLIATVYFPKLEKGTLANFNGQYSIENIPEGMHTVVYSMLGYSTISKKIFFSENKSVIQDIQMSESAVEMEEIIISTPFHKLQSDNVMKVERMSVDDLTSKGAATLSEGITNIAGVSSITTGTGIGKPVIRGLSANRVLTYAQGVRMENQQFGDEHGLGLNASGIESVEVIKGPASLLYGSDALGGVLYLNPERFAETGSTTVDAGSTYLTNTQGTTSSIGVKTSGENLRFLARGAFASQSDYKTGSGDRVTNSRFTEKDLKGAIGYQNTKLKSILRYNYNRSEIGIPEEIGVQSTSTTLLTPFQEIDNHILSLDNKWFLKNSSLDLKAGYLFNNRKEFAEESNPELQLKLNTFNYDLTYHLPEFGKFETLAGIQGMFQNNRNYAEEILIPDASVSDIGVFGTTHYHLEKLDLQGGLRFDSRTIDSKAMGVISDSDYIPALSKSFTSFNAAIGAKANLTEQFIARLNLASGFRAPNLAELTSNGVHEGTNRYERGNPNLKSEQNLQTDLSLEFRNEHFEISANGFYNSIRDYIFISPSEEIVEDIPVYNYVQADAALYGGELGVHIHPHPIDWLHFESSFETVLGELTNGTYLPLLPANSLKNTLRAEFEAIRALKSPYLFVTFENVFAQNRTGAFETASEGYNLLSLGAGSQFEIQKIELKTGVSITNLTDEKYISHLSRLKQDGIENIGRNVNIHLKLSI